MKREAWSRAERYGVQEAGIPGKSLGKTGNWEPGEKVSGLRMEELFEKRYPDKKYKDLKSL